MDKMINIILVFCLVLSPSQVSGQAESRKMRKKLTIFACITLIVLLGATIEVAAQAPNTIMYQGRLTAADGQPITAATDVTFAIYAAASGGAALFTSTQSVTPDENGVFTVELGPIPVSVFDGSKRYVGLKVGDDAEMTPRQLLTSTPYSIGTATVPGIAHNYQNVNATLGTSATVIDSIMITVPTSGYIVYQAAGAVELQLNATGAVKTIISLSASRTSMNYGNMTNFDLGVQAADYYYTPVSIIVVDVVPAAGTYKYYLLGTKSSGVTTAIAYRCHILATFYPTSYGSVDESKSNFNSSSATPDGDNIDNH